MTDLEKVRELKKECECRAAANTGEERRFFHSLAIVLEDHIEAELEYEHAHNLVTKL